MPTFFFSQTTLLNPHDTSDKRPKLERARSAAEKENQPLQRTGSQLRRQYSQQETSTQRRASASASDSGVDDNYLQRSHLHSQHQTGIGGGGSNVDGQYMNQSPQYRNTSSSYYPNSGGYAPDNDPRYYQVRAIVTTSTNEVKMGRYFQGEIEDLMRTHPHLVHPRQQSYISQQSQQQSSYMKPQKSAQEMQQHYGMQDPYAKTHKRPLGGGPYLPQQRSFSSSEEELRSTPEFEGELTLAFRFHSHQKSIISVSNLMLKVFTFCLDKQNKRKRSTFSTPPKQDRERKNRLIAKVVYFEFVTNKTATQPTNRTC